MESYSPALTASTGTKDGGEGGAVGQQVAQTLIVICCCDTQTAA